MNPPFSAVAHVESRVADAALRHIASALARLAEGGRLVAITGANLSPDDPAWRDGFVRLQERGRVVFSAAIDGRVYARHGTTIDTRLTVIDRVPADDPASFPASPGTAADPGDPARLGHPARSARDRSCQPAHRARSRSLDRRARRRDACRTFAASASCVCTRPGRRRRARLRAHRLDAGARAPTSATRSTSPTPCSRSAFRERSRTRPGSCNRRRWLRWRRRSPATGRICRPVSSPTACCRTRSSRA